MSFSRRRIVQAFPEAINLQKYYMDLAHNLRYNTSIQLNADTYLDSPAWNCIERWHKFE